MVRRLTCRERRDLFRVRSKLSRSKSGGRVALERPSPGGAIFPKAKQPRNPGRRESSVLEHALKQPGGSQMRKQMRSTFRIPGTEDRSIEGNAPRSGGAEEVAVGAIWIPPGG
jgi:hypothetical protein